MEHKIAVVTIPVSIPMAEALLKKAGFSGTILEMTMDDYDELKEKFAPKQEGVTDGK